MIHAAPLRSAGPAGLDETIDLVAGQLDAAFLGSGRSLASAYELVETLIAKLGGHTGALDHEGAGRAIANLEATAARIAGIPDAIDARSKALGSLAAAHRLVGAQVFTFDRTLDFLRVCALNIKIAAAGREGFGEFGDLMVARLDVSGGEIRAIRAEMQKLLSIIPAVSVVDHALARQCGSIAAEVPGELVDNARGLRLYLQAAAARSDEVAELAQAIRDRLAEALGAMQIGDIARQRLEHVAQGLRLFRTHFGPDDLDSENRSAEASHFLALLDAQASGATAEFLSESERLATSQRLIGPDLARLLAIREGKEDGEGSADFLQRLEGKVGAVSALTCDLRDVDRRALALAAETATMVERLGTRLAVIHRITAEVDNMAWNAEIRCGNMGEDGRGIAPIAAEIRKLVGHLKRISAETQSAVWQLHDAAQAMTAGAADLPGNGETLEQCLGIIRDGARRMEDSLAGLDAEAANVAAVLGQAVDSVAAIGELSAPLQAAAAGLSAYAPQPPIEAPILSDRGQELVAALARTYTMASEREIHARFTVGESHISSTSVPDDIDDEDDGLF